MSFKEFFYFQKSDRRVIVVALCVAVVALSLVYFVGENNSTTSSDSNEATDADSVTATLSREKGGFTYAVAEGRERHLVPFDPNTADSTILLGLGLQPWQVRNIYRYRSKGGIYRQPEDFARVYGLTVGQYRELAPYIRISPDYRPAAEVYGGRRGSYSSSSYSPTTPNKSSQGSFSQTSSIQDASVADGRPSSYQPQRHSLDTLRYPVKLKSGEQIDLNAADTTLLKRVPGIGSYYARRVVAYRERLGGFYSTDQLFEIEGFPEAAVDFLNCKPLTRRLNVNKLSLSQLRQHPYINFYQAKAIADYRRLKGPLHSLDELSLLPDFPPEAIARLAHYVEF